jgi:hypothetical protein
MQIAVAITTATAALAKRLGLEDSDKAVELSHAVTALQGDGVRLPSPV